LPGGEGRGPSRDWRGAVISDRTRAKVHGVSKALDTWLSGSLFRERRCHDSKDRWKRLDLRIAPVGAGLRFSFLDLSKELNLQSLLRS